MQINFVQFVCTHRRMAKSNAKIYIIGIRVWNTLYFKSVQKLMTGNRNNTASPSDWRFKKVLYPPSNKRHNGPHGNTRTYFLGSRRILSPCCFQSPFSSLILHISDYFQDIRFKSIFIDSSRITTHLLICSVTLSGQWLRTTKGVTVNNLCIS